MDIMPPVSLRWDTIERRWYVEYLYHHMIIKSKLYVTRFFAKRFYDKACALVSREQNGLG